MILDSSAIVAIATEEPGCLELLEKLDQAETLAVFDNVTAIVEKRSPSGGTTSPLVILEWSGIR